MRYFSEDDPVVSEQTKNSRGQRHSVCLHLTPRMNRRRLASMFDLTEWRWQVLPIELTDVVKAGYIAVLPVTTF